MHSMFRFIKNKYGLVAILLVAVLSMGFVTKAQKALSANCPQLAPTHPQFDVWPINYDPTTVCTDAAQVDAYNINASSSSRDGNFAASQAEHDAGINANIGDEVWVSVYFHNGASDQVDRNLTTAHNVVIAANLTGGSQTAHSISSQISASNATTVSSASRGGPIVIHTAQPSTLSYIPGSSSLCITLPHATERVGASAANLPDCGNSDKQLAIGDGVASGGFNLGDLKACFPYSGTLDFKVKVNAVAAQPGALAISKLVENQTSGQTTFVNSTSARPGDIVTYKATVTNTGSSNVDNVVIDDPGASGIVPGPNTSFPIHFSAGTLTPGQSKFVLYDARVTAQSGSVVNTATASGANVASVSDSATVTVNQVVQNASMSITKGVTNFTRGNTGFAPSVNAFLGDNVGFQIVLNNTGNTTLNNVNISDNLPFGLNMIPGTLAVSTGINTFNNVNLSNISIGNLNVGQQVIVSFSAIVNQTGTLTNTVTATASNANTVSAQAQVIVQTVVNNPGSLTVTKLVKNETQGNAFFSKSVTANPGDRIAFQISIGAQNGSVNSVNVFDSLPQFFNYANGSARLNGNFLSDSLVNGGTNIGTINQGQTMTIFFEGNVNGSIPNGQTVLTNNVSVSAQNAPTVTDSANIVINNNAQAFSQLSINKLVRNISFQNILQKNISAFSNDRVGFQITVTNTGTAAINNVTVRDILPGGFTYAFGTTRMDGSQVSDISNSQVFLGTMNPGQQHTITFEGTVNGPDNSTIQNTAFAQGDNASQVQDTASVVIKPQVLGANVNIIQSKRAFNETRNADATLVTAQKEDFITYTLTVVNSGNAPADNYVISDDLSGVLSLSSLVNNGGGTLNGSVLSWPPVTIPANGTVTETFRVRINFFLPANQNLLLTNTFGNTVVIHVGQVLGETFVPPKTGSSMEVALGFGAMITAGFALMRRKLSFAKLFAFVPKVRIK